MQEWVMAAKSFIDQADFPIMFALLGFAIWTKRLRLGREYDDLKEQCDEAKAQIKGYEKVATVTTQMAATVLPNGGSNVG